jgi:hypothetical protein
MLDGPPDAGRSPVRHGLASQCIVPIINGLAGHFQYSLCMDWPVSTVPLLPGSLIIIPITYGLAGYVLYSFFMDWPDKYCTHCSWTGWTCIALIVHGLAGPVLYPLLTSWPAVGYNPMLGLRDTINPVLGLCGADQGLG